MVATENLIVVNEHAGMQSFTRCLHARRFQDLEEVYACAQFAPEKGRLEELEGRLVTVLHRRPAGTPVTADTFADLKKSCEGCQIQHLRS